MILFRDLKDADILSAGFFSTRTKLCKRMYCYAPRPPTQNV